jgi:hypothetical protein
VPTLADLLGAIAAAPNLTGAACRDYPVTFEATTSRSAGQPYVYDRAIKVCMSCPALQACRAWVESLPPADRPPGVTAGTIRYIGGVPNPKGHR